MSFPPLEHWDATRAGLHRAAQVIGAVKVASIARQPNHLHHSLSVVPQGLTTGVLPSGTLTLDFGAAALKFDAPGKRFTLPLAGHSRASLATALLVQLTIAGHTVPLDHTALTDTEPLEVDLRTGAEYAQVLYRVFTVMARFRARLYGMLSPLVLWQHHFDLSFLWFAGADDENQPHLNFGFAPESPGLPRPYFYAYAYPLPDGFTPPALPMPARWVAESWRGVVLDYDTLRAEQADDARVEALLMDIYAALLPVVRGAGGAAL